MSSSKFKKTGIVSLYKSIEYSLHGLLFAFKSEQAFRFEILMGGILCLILVVSDAQIANKVFLLLLYLFLLVVELINSAIELLSDRVSLEFDMNIKRVKDMGSAAVFIALVMNIVAWSYYFKDFFYTLIA